MSEPVDVKSETVESVGDESEEVSSPDASPGKINSLMAANAAQALAGMEDQLNGLTIDPQAFVASLPPSVKRRLKALKKLQMQHVNVESKFYEEIHQLEVKYAEKFASIRERRANIVIGEVEPTDSECDWASDEEDEGEAGGDTKKSNVVNSADVTGVPDFWLTVMQHTGELSEIIQDHDEPILKHLTDIRLVLSNPGEPISYTLEFFFSPNEYFTNGTLTKKYFMKMEPEEKDLLFEGPEISSCEGCTIDWKPGKNVTVKTIKKKQKNKKSGVMRTVTKQVPNESFFNYFSPPSAEDQEEPPNEEIEAQLQNDFELGHFFRDQVVPRAVLYFTGDAVEIDSDDDEDDDEYDEDEDEDDDEDEPAPRGGRRGKGPSGALQNGDGGQQPDCKQQ